MKHLILLLILAFPAFGATNRTVTVKTSGGDYTTLAAAIAGEKGDMVALDRQLTIECYAMQDTTAVTIAEADWTTDATRYILITAPAGQRHAGVYSTSAYRLEVTNGQALTIGESGFIRVDGLQFSNTGNYNLVRLIPETAGATDYRFSNTIFRGTSSMASKYLLSWANTANASNTVSVWNCLFYGASNSTGTAIRVELAGSYYIYNNTIAGNGVGVSRTTGTAILKNNLFSGNTSNGNGALAAGTDYNRTSNSTLGYTVTGDGNTHDAVSQTFTFVNAGAYDWHLTVDDAGAKDLGVSDPGSGLFSTDVDGETRSGSWDVGFDEYPSAATRRRNAVVAWRRP